jgi:hypothetical protein
MLGSPWHPLDPAQVNWLDIAVPPFPGGVFPNVASWAERPMTLWPVLSVAPPPAATQKNDPPASMLSEPLVLPGAELLCITAGAFVAVLMALVPLAVVWQPIHELFSSPYVELAVMDIPAWLLCIVWQLLQTMESGTLASNVPGKKNNSKVNTNLCNLYPHRFIYFRVNI